VPVAATVLLPTPEYDWRDGLVTGVPTIVPAVVTDAWDPPATLDPEPAPTVDPEPASTVTVDAAMVTVTVAPPAPHSVGSAPLPPTSVVDVRSTVAIEVDFKISVLESDDSIPIAPFVTDAEDVTVPEALLTEAVAGDKAVLEPEMVETEARTGDTAEVAEPVLPVTDAVTLEAPVGAETPETVSTPVG